MDLPNQIGARCAHPVCDLNDFLPIRCPLCTEIFCREHASPPDKHQCFGARNDVVGDGEGAKMTRCEIEGCKKITLGFESSGTGGSSVTTTAREAAGGRCPGCGGAFCASHRHAVSHACPSAQSDRDPVTKKNAEAKTLLAKVFPASQSTKTSKVGGPKNTMVTTSGSAPTRQKVMTPGQKKIELMRMRHKAVPIDPRFNQKGATQPGLDKRRFFIAGLQGNEAAGVLGEMAFWSTQDMPTGRLLDNLARVLKVNGSTPKMRLEKMVIETVGEPSTRVILDLSGQIGEQTEDGDTLVLVLDRAEGSS